MNKIKVLILGFGIKIKLGDWDGTIVRYINHVNYPVIRSGNFTF